MTVQMALRAKYRLVHVPSLRRVEDWAAATLAAIAEGMPREAAGLQAARVVFPYEAARQASPDAPAVDEILALAGHR